MFIHTRCECTHTHTQRGDEDKTDTNGERPEIPMIWFFDQRDKPRQNGGKMMK